MTDAEAAQAEGGECVFGALDLFKHLGGDAAAVFDARGEACRGGLVPDIERGGAGKGADVFLGQPSIGERREHGVLRGGLLAGAVVAGVVGVEAVDDVRDAAGGALALEDGEELVLAVEAAGGVVAGVVLAGELGGGDGDERNGLRGGEGYGLAEMAAGERGRVRDDGEHAAAEDGVSGMREIGGVDAAGVGDDDALEFLETAMERFAFRRQIRRETGDLRIRDGGGGHISDVSV